MAKGSPTDHRRTRGLGPHGGFTVIELIFVTVLVAIIAAIAIPTYTSLIQRAKETSAVSYLDKTRKAQEIYRLDGPTGLFSASFDELETTGLIPAATGASVRVEEGYQMTLSAGVVSGVPVWSVSASPLAANPKAKHFYTDQTGALRYSVGTPADSSSPVFQQ